MFVNNLQPDKMSIATFPADLLEHFIFPEALHFRTNQVCRRWAEIFRRDTVWENIARKIGCPKLSAIPGQMHIAVKQFCKELLKNIAQLPEVPDDIKAQLPGEITAEKMTRLIKWQSARYCCCLA